jgi:hypothetical protein
MLRLSRALVIQQIELLMDWLSSPPTGLPSGTLRFGLEVVKGEPSRRLTYGSSMR